MIELFLVSYQISNFENDSTQLNSQQLSLDLNEILGNQKVTESSILVEWDLEDDQTMNADDVYEYIEHNLTEKGYNEDELGNLRLAVVKADPESNIILINPLYEENNSDN